MPPDQQPAVGLVPVKDCPCGYEHLMSAGAWVQYQLASHGKPPMVAVRVQGEPGVFMVPRLFIACHKMQGRDVVWLADLYGWEATRPAEDDGGGGS